MKKSDGFLAYDGRIVGFANKMGEIILLTLGVCSYMGNYTVGDSDRGMDTAGSTVWFFAAAVCLCDAVSVSCVFQI